MSASLPPPSDPSMAERKRQLVRDELTQAALKLLVGQGFEATTIDEIVAAAGVSRRTFFRYFRSKEDVIVEFLGDVGTRLCAELAGRPTGERPAVALRHAFSVFVAACRAEPEKFLRFTKLMTATPALQGRFLERQARWRADLAAELGRRADLDPPTDLRPALAAGVALAAFDAALNRWAATEGAEDLGELIDEAFALVSPALDCSDGVGRPRA